MVILQPKKATDVWSSLFLPNGAVALGSSISKPCLLRVSKTHLVSLSLSFRLSFRLRLPPPLHPFTLAISSPLDPSDVLFLGPFAVLATRGASLLPRWNERRRGEVVRHEDLLEERERDGTCGRRRWWWSGGDQDGKSRGGDEGCGREECRCGGDERRCESKTRRVFFFLFVARQETDRRFLVCFSFQLQIYDLRFLPQPSLSSTHRLPTSFGSSSHHHSKPKPKPFQQPNPSFTPTTPPTFSLPSHVNSYTTGLALLYHASSETVLAAGQDRKVRVWDARNGRLLEEDWGRKSGAGGWGGTVKGLVDLEEGRGVGSVDGERWEVWK